MSDKVKVTIIGMENSYYVKTLKDWFMEIRDILEENLGKQVEFEVKDSDTEIPIMLVNGKEVFEGLPDNEGTLIEIILSNANRDP